MTDKPEDLILGAVFGAAIAACEAAAAETPEEARKAALKAVELSSFAAEKSQELSKTK